MSDYDEYTLLKSFIEDVETLAQSTGKPVEVINCAAQLLIADRLDTIFRVLTDEYIKVLTYEGR